MVRNTALMIIAMILMVTLFGCGSSRVQEEWGRSYEAAKYNQTLDREADRNLAPVEGMDGQSALRVLDTYHKGGAEQKKSSSGFGVLTLQK